MSKKIFKNSVVTENEWRYISDADINDIPHGKIILPLDVWNKNYKALNERQVKPGLLIDSHESPSDFLGDITSIPLIAVNFPVFSDGRGFSLGSLLRERYAYKNELRATGGFIHDQLYYLKRCGFDSFELSSDADPDAICKLLASFSNDYQSSANRDLPLFRRRSNT